MSLKVEQLSKSFQGRPVLRSLSFTAYGPLCVMGPSGCGKTTLLRILMGLETADEGQCSGTGRIAAVFQENRLCPQLTAADNICLTAGRAVVRSEVERELEALGFRPEDLRLPACRLSGGQRRRVALLRALLCRTADTLLLDEPFTGMDQALVADAAAAICRLAGTRNVLLVTHDEKAAELLQWPVLRMRPVTEEVVQ